MSCDFFFLFLLLSYFLFSFFFVVVRFLYGEENITLEFFKCENTMPEQTGNTGETFFHFQILYVYTYIHTYGYITDNLFLWHTSSRTFELAVKFDIDFLKFISFVLLFFSCYFFFCLFSCFFLFLSKVYSTYYIVVNSVCLLYFYVALLSNILLTNASIPQLVLLLLLLLLLIRACKLLFILYM